MDNQWLPYEISFLPRPNARKRVTWIRFGPSMEETLSSTKEAARKERYDASAWLIRRAGREAEGRVHGVLRGGVVFDKRFYFHGPHPSIVMVTDVIDLEFNFSA